MDEAGNSPESSADFTDDARNPHVRPEAPLAASPGDDIAGDWGLSMKDRVHVPSVPNLTVLTGNPGGR